MSEGESAEGGFEVLAEWRIRRLRPVEDEGDQAYGEKVKRWVLYSLGLEREHQDIYLYLEDRMKATSTEIAEKFQMSPNTARRYLDELHTVGLVDYVGREYTLTYNSLSRAIELALIPRVTDTLRTIAKGATNSDQTPYTFTPSGGGEVVMEKGVTRINQRLLDAWSQAGKRVHVKSFGSLTVDPDTSPEALDAVVARIDVFGQMTIPENLFARISHKIRAFGNVSYS